MTTSTTPVALLPPPSTQRGESPEAVPLTRDRYSIEARRLESTLGLWATTLLDNEHSYRVYIDAFYGRLRRRPQFRRLFQ